MEESPLPNELRQLERDLLGRRCAPTPEGLRQRVLNEVCRQACAERARDRRRFAALAAIAALLWINLSISAAQVTDYGLRPRRANDSAEAVARQLQQLEPELPVAEVRRQAVLLCAGTNLDLVADRLGTRVNGD